MSSNHSSRHYVRGLRGVKKGRFVKKKVLIATENRAKAVMESAKKAREKAKSVGVTSNTTIESGKGNRIVDLQLLGENLWCLQCKIPLSLSNIVNEKKNGLATLLTVSCSFCNFQREVVSSSRVHTNDKVSYAINLQAAFGMLDGGIGESHLNTVLSALHLPTVTTVSLKKSERIVGRAIEDVAKQSCIDSIQLEKEMTVSHQVVIDHDGPVPENVSYSSEIIELTGSYDTGWQKRGTGRAYNSLSGHGILVGHYSGKILSYTVRCTDCIFCKKGHPQSDHDCRQNFQGTAKAMEPNMAIDLIVKNDLLKMSNAIIKYLICDDDASIPAAVRRHAPYEIQKWSDYNHTLKSFTSGLYTLKLSRKLIEYFSHCFSHAIRQNKGNASTMRDALKSILPHAFGDHELCARSCSTDEKYVHKNLPNGKPLENQDLFNCLNKLITRYINNVDKIAPCGSTQANESINSMISQKCVKSRHYSGSESVCFRVAAAICQKNIGNNYQIQVYNKLNINIYEKSSSHRQQKDRKREKRKQKCVEKTYKKRRLMLKKMRSSKNSACSKKEGFTYESSLTLDSISDSLPCISSPTVTNADICKILFFDIETTGLSMSDQICQIAVCGNDTEFNTYIIPSKTISKQASEVTGLHIINGELFYRDEKVEAHSAKVAFTLFLNYLKQFDVPIILSAHNGFRFDAPRILQLASQLGMSDELKSVVYGFTDTLLVFKKCLSIRVKEKKSFSIQALVADYLPNENLQNLHNALDDVKILQCLMITLNISESVMKESAKSTANLLIAKQEANLINKCTISLSCLKGSISSGMIHRMAKTGISFNILNDAFQKSKIEGIRALLTESVDGKARVTTNKKIISNVYEYFINISKDTAK